MLCCTSAVLQGCRTAATHNCSCNDEQGCCHLATDCSSAAKGMHRFLGMLAVHHFCSSAGLYELQNQPCRTAEVMHSKHAQKPVHTLCSTAAVSGKVATALLIIATTIMCCCSSTALQNCRSAAQQPCPETCASLCSTAAVSGKVATALLVTATTPMSRCSSTALQNCRSAAQQPRLKTCACPLQHCCCQ